MDPDFYNERHGAAWSRGLQHASGLLIKRGTALGPMVPPLFLVPFLVGAAWLFRTTLLFAIPLLLTAICIVIVYCHQYIKFATSDPDRLQSEKYRYDMKRIHMIAAKELSVSVPANVVPFDDAVSNPAHPLPEVIDTGVREANKEIEDLK